MPSNLLEMVKNYFTRDFINNASSTVGENASSVSKALTAIIPTGLAGILNKATSGTEGADHIFDTAKNSVETVTGNSALTSNQNIEKGNSIINNLFGASQSGIPGTISQYAGIKESSSASLMAMAMPAMMGILGKHAEQNNLFASGLAGYLSSQKDYILQAIPSGSSSIAGMLGLGSIASGTGSQASDIKSPHLKTPTHEITTISERPTAKWLVPLIVIVVIVLLLWYFSRGCGETKPSPEAPTDTTSIIQNTPATVAIGDTRVMNGFITLS